MPHDDRDIHERIFDEITGRIHAAESAINTSSEEDRLEAESELGRLRGDLDLLREHWVAQGLVHHSVPPISKACRNPQPCPHTLALAEKYGLLREA